MPLRWSARIVAITMLFLVSPVLRAQTLLGNAFTYQGRLGQSGTPASGSFPMAFKLWDAPSAGNQVGPTLTFDGTGGNPAPVSVADGLFNVPLDFGAGRFGANARWLETTVNGVVLSPRTQIMPAPTALFSAAPWTTNPGIGISYSGSGGVGIGGLAPLNKLSVTGNADFSGNVGIGIGVPTNRLSVNGNADVLGHLGVGRISTANSLSVGGNADFSGNVGIGVSTPDQTLTVNGNASKPGGGSWAVFSDSRLKHDIEPMSGTLDRLLLLRGYSFEYNNDAVAGGKGLPGKQLGLMADEVECVFPDWVSRTDSGYLCVTERATTALMVEALRDLRTEKDAEIAELRLQNTQLAERLNALESLVEKLTGKP